METPIFSYTLDREYETMPYRIYMRYYGDESVEIAKAYSLQEARLIVHALNLADPVLINAMIRTAQHTAQGKYMPVLKHVKP